MKYYAVASLNFKNPLWIQDYLRDVTPMVTKVGGKYLARTSKIEKIEGTAALPESMLIIEFPSKEAAEQFYYSEEYQPHKEARLNGSVGDFFLIAGEDIANAG